MTSLPATRKFRWEEAVFAFLRMELAPSATRWRASLRLTLLCAVATTVVMAFHIPNGEFLIIFFFAVSQRDAWASFRKARLRGIGTVLGGAFAILVIVACGDKPWLFFVTQSLIFAAGLFLMRTTTIPYAFLLAMFTFVIAVPPVATDPEAGLETVLWRILLTMSGAVIGTMAQLILWPEHPEGILLRKLAARLRAAEAIVARAADDRTMVMTVDADSPSARATLSSAMAVQLDLLASVEAGSRWFRRRHAEQAKLISDAEMILVTAFRMEELSRESPAAVHEKPVAGLLGELRSDLSQLACALEQGLPPAPMVDRGGEAARASLRTRAPASALLATILDLQRSVSQVPESMAFLAASGARGARGRRDYSPVREPIGERAIFTPACRLSNVEVLRFALKGTLAASICYVIYQALDWPGISTSVVTCLITAQSSFGAGLQKSLLRLAGAIVGALMAVVVIMVMWPNMVSLASFVVVTSVLFFAASWINSGSSRISYVGMQTGLVLALLLVNHPNQEASLAPAGDRIVGVLLGISVMGFIDRILWPSFAGEALRGKLAEVLRGLAGVARSIGLMDWEQAREATFGVHREIAAALGLYGESQFEIFPARTEGRSDSRRLLAVTNAAADVFLSMQRVVLHRRDLEKLVAPEDWWQRMRTLDEAVTIRLEALAGWPGISLGALFSGRNWLRAGGASGMHRVPNAADRSPVIPFIQSEQVCRELIEALDKLEVAVVAVDRELPSEGEVGLTIPTIRPAN